MYVEIGILGACACAGWACPARTHSAGEGLSGAMRGGELEPRILSHQLDVRFSVRLPGALGVKVKGVATEKG